MRFLVFLVAASLIAPSQGAAADRHQAALKRAHAIFTELAGRVPDPVRHATRCVSVLSIGKGGFIFGGTGGSGFLTCRSEGGTTWSAPIVLDIGGGSAGLQIGGSKVEVVMVYTKVGDIEELARTSPIFGGQASATAGDQGIGLSGGGNPEAKSGILTVSRSEGLYAGAVGEGLVLNADRKTTAELLGGEYSLEDVLVRRKVAVPGDAKALIQAVTSWGKL
jgi:lipid-binding SYLF domain-containing protein